MEKKERLYRIHKIFNLCLNIQESGEGVNGHPLVQLESGNYGSRLAVWVLDKGWDDYMCDYDGTYYPLESDEEYSVCVEHLKRLLARIKEVEPCHTQELDEKQE